VVPAPLEAATADFADGRASEFRAAYDQRVLP